MSDKVEKPLGRKAYGREGRRINFVVKPYMFGDDVIGNDPFPCTCDYTQDCIHGREIQNWFKRQEVHWNRQP